MRVINIWVWFFQGLKRQIFFWRNIAYISNIDDARHDIEHWLSIGGNFEKILVILVIYRFEDEKSSVEQRAERRRKLVKILEIYQRYIGEISEIFKIFWKNIYHFFIVLIIDFFFFNFKSTLSFYFILFFIFNYFLYLSH